MIFVFWELVGFSSYLLIAHYFTTEEAAQASKKAFIVNRSWGFWVFDWYHSYLLECRYR